MTHEMQKFTCNWRCHCVLSSWTRCLRSFSERLASASRSLLAINSSCKCATELSGVVSRNVFLSSSSSSIFVFRLRTVSSPSAKLCRTFTNSSNRQLTISSRCLSASSFKQSSSMEFWCELFYIMVCEGRKWRAVSVKIPIIIVNELVHSMSFLFLSR